MEVDEVAFETQTLSNETDGGFKMCEVEAQQVAGVEVHGPKRRVIRVDSEKTQDCSQEEADEIGLVPSAVSESISRSLLLV